MKNKTPKTWDELLDAGYVTELTEEQIAIARDRFRGEPRPFSYANEDHLKGNDIQEQRMRKAANK